MANIIQSIQNDQSNGLNNRVLNEPAQSVNMFKAPVSTQKINSNLDNLTSFDVLQFPADRPKYYLSMQIANYSRQSLLQLGTLTPRETIILPLPTQLIDAQGVSYQETSLGAFGAAVQAVTNDGSIMKNTIDATNQLVTEGNLSGAFNKGVELLKDAAAQGKNASLAGAAQGAAGIGANYALGESDATRAVAGVLGYSPNQFFTILLKGPQYKKHQFSWKFSPRNEQESRNLRLIIQKLNNYMAPGLRLSGAIFAFPQIFQLAFMPNSSYMFKFKPAVLESFTVNYAGSGIPAFYRASLATNNLNAPESIEIVCSFMELEYWIAGDFKNVEDGLLGSGSAIGEPLNDPTDTHGRGNY